MKNLNFPIDYRTFNDNCPDSEIATKLISTKESEITTRPMWRMEMLAKYYGVNIYDYDDSDDQWYYYEIMRAIYPEDVREPYDHTESLHPDSYDKYFLRVAEIAAEVGDKRAEIKCLIKSLMIKYRHAESLNGFPHKEFEQLYTSLTTSNDMEQLRVAERLGRYHTQELDLYIRRSIRDKMQRLTLYKE